MYFPCCIDAELCVRLVQTLSHFIWQGIVIFLLLWLAAYLMPQRSSSTRYAVSLFALLLMVVCPTITFILINPIGQQKTVASFATAPSNGISEISAHITQQTEPPKIVGIQADYMNWQRYAPHATLAYFAGVLTMFARLLIALHGGRRLCLRSQPINDPCIKNTLTRQAKTVGLSFVPAIGYCQRIVVPTVIGVLHPMILLPISVSTGLNPIQIEALLAHELAHIRRYDHLINIVQRIIEAILFYHPCVWLISRRVRLERENCCDDLVLNGGLEKITYADALIKMAEIVLASRTGHPLATMAGVGAANQLSPLRQRILRIIEHSTYKPVRVVSGAQIIVTILFLIMTLSVFQLAASGSLDSLVVKQTNPLSVTKGNVYILGHIKQPGIYAIPENRDLTLTKLITTAGGYSGNDIKHASVTLTKPAPDGKHYIARKIDFLTLIKNNAYDVVLNDDDRIYVTSGPTSTTIPPAAQKSPRGAVSILGQIKLPGIYAIPESQNLTLMKLIDAAGSFDGDDLEHASITLSRYGADGKRHIACKLGLKTLFENPKEDVLLCSGDLITLSAKPLYRPVHRLRLVVGQNRMTLQGQDVTWDSLPAILTSTPNRLYTVLCIAMAENDIPTKEQFNVVLRKASEIVDIYGFEAYEFVDPKPLGDRAASVQYIPIESMHYGAQKAIYVDDSLIQTHITDPPGRPQYAVRLVIGADRMTFEGKDVDFQTLPDVLNNLTDRQFTVFEIAIASDSPPGDRFKDAKAWAIKLQHQFGFESFKEVRPQLLGTVGSMTRYFATEDTTTMPRHTAVQHRQESVGLQG